MKNLATRRRLHLSLGSQICETTGGTKRCCLGQQRISLLLHFLKIGVFLTLNWTTIFDFRLHKSKM